MTRRSLKYFNLKAAFRLIGSPAGRAKLAARGVYPLQFTVSGSHIASSLNDGYMIDKKGRVVGTTIQHSKPPHTIWVHAPKLPTSYEVKFEFADPDASNDFL